MCDLNTVFKFADTLGNYERFYCFVNIFTGLLCPWRILEWSDQVPLWLRQLMWWNILFNDNKTRCHCIFHCINVKSFSRDLLSCYIMQDESFVWHAIKYREMLYSCCWISTLTTLADIFFDSASVNSSCVRPPHPHPRGDCGAFALLVSPGARALANLARPGGRVLGSFSNDDGDGKENGTWK